jgi:hypothetical protein
MNIYEYHVIYSVRYHLRFHTCGYGGTPLLIGNRSTWSKTCPSATLSTTILHGLAWDQTQNYAARDWQLTTLALVWPSIPYFNCSYACMLCL